MKRETIIALRSIFSNLYPTVEDSARVARDAHIPEDFIAFNSKPILNWEAILDEAEKGNKVPALIDVVLNDYRDHPLLKQIKEEGDIEHSSAPVIGEGLKWRSETPVSTLEKLMGKESTLLPISFLEIGLERSRSVARVKLADGSTGSGFLTKNNLFVTNHHVLENASQAAEAVIQFNYQNTFTGLDLEPTAFNLDPANGFATSADDDWTLVRVNGDANAEWGKIDLKRIDDYEKIQYVNIIQHPAGGPKQIALYNNIVAYADERLFQYLTDTLEGSSGSPVFDNRWRVVALHHSGGNILDPGTKKPVFRNEGININLIVKAMESLI